MTLEEYSKQFKLNMIVMSRTADGASGTAEKNDPMAAQETEKEKVLAIVNTKKALEYLYENRRSSFDTEKNVEELILKTAETVNSGIVKDGGIFRCGEDSAEYKYVRIKDIPEMWRWFVKTLHWMITSSCFEPEETSAFSEYVINMAGHFFSNGCEMISMLISTFVFMRYDLPCVKYNSRDEYYRIAERSEIPTVEGLRLFLSNAEFENFLSYYLSLCPSRENDSYIRSFSCYYEMQSSGEYVCRLKGYLVEETSGNFGRTVEQFYEKHGDVQLVIDCKELWAVSVEGTDVLKKMKAEDRRFTLKNLNIDCTVLLKSAGLAEFFDSSCTIPQIDLSKCAVLGGGKNGTVYRVSDEIVAKTFAQDADYTSIIRERRSQKLAFVSGVPAPISFGYAEYQGNTVILMECVDSNSLLKILSSEDASDEFIVQYARLIKELHSIQSRNKLNGFSKNFFGNDILKKADRVDRVMPEEYIGKARKIIESINEKECLVHGDIQPGNIMVSGGEMLFIDFDTFSTGKSIYDLGALYRTLFSDVEDINYGREPYLHLPPDRYDKIWRVFFKEYYAGEPEEMLRRKEAATKIIGYVLMLAKNVKNNADPERISRQSELLKKSIDEYENAC